MAVSSVSFGSNPTQATTAKKKMSPVKTGAAVGAIFGVGTVASAAMYMRPAEGFVKYAKQNKGNAALIAAGAAAAIAISSLFYAGIGKLIKNHQEKKAEKADSTKVFTTQA